MHSTSGGDFSELGEGDKLTWDQFHAKGWGARECEGHASVTIHNNTGSAVTLKWIFLGSQSTVDLIENERMLVKTRTVQGEGAIRVNYNSDVKIVERVGDLPGYGTGWYKPTGIANILSMSMVTK